MDVVELDRERPRYRLRRMLRDFDVIERAPRDRPIPMVSAPWLPGPRAHAIHYPHERPVAVHLWSHFECFPAVESMLYRWVVDDEHLEGTDGRRGDDQ